MRQMLTDCKIAAFAAKYERDQVKGEYCAANEAQSYVARGIVRVNSVH